MAVSSIAEKAQAYGLPGVRVDGNDPLEMHRVTRQASARARRGDGPTLIEAITYRLSSHTSNDDERRYRPRAEVEIWRGKDPVPGFRLRLLEDGMLTEEQDREVWSRARREVDEAEGFAESRPIPRPEDSLLHDIGGTAA